MRIVFRVKSLAHTRCAHNISGNRIGVGMSITMDDLRAMANAAQEALFLIPREKWGEPVDCDDPSCKMIDKVVENTVLDYILRHGLALNVVSEEIGFVDNGAEDTLVMDPIDGTTNALSGLPLFSICLAVGRKNLSDIDLALVKIPLLNEEYAAEKGKGAFKNGEPLKVRKTSNLDHLMLTIYLGGKAARESLEVIKSVDTCRYLGCASLEMLTVAEGATDGYLMDSEVYERSVRVFDIAASYLILREAGGNVLCLDGSPFDMPLDMDARSNFIAFGDKKVFDFIRKKGRVGIGERFGIYANIRTPGIEGYVKRIMEVLEGREIVLDEALAKVLG